MKQANKVIRKTTKNCDSSLKTQQNMGSWLKKLAQIRKYSILKEMSTYNKFLTLE